VTIANRRLALLAILLTILFIHTFLPIFSVQAWEGHGEGTTDVAQRLLKITLLGVTNELNIEGSLVDNGWNEVKVCVTDEHGDPITDAIVTMKAEREWGTLSFVHEGNGIYLWKSKHWKGEPVTGLEMYSMEINAEKEGFTSALLVVEVPALIMSYNIEPVKDWYIAPLRRGIVVKVDNRYYLAVPASEDPLRQLASGIYSHTWLILDENGYVVTDESTYKKCALTAEVAFITEGDKRELLQRTLLDCARWWYELPLFATTADAAAKVRDYAAKALGVIASAYIATPSFIAKVTETATFKVTKTVVETALDAASISAESYRMAEITAANSFLLYAADKAKQAADVLEKHRGVWDYATARDFYLNFRDAMVTGMESMVLRVEALPPGDVYNQIKNVLTNFAEGALSIELAVDELINLDEPLKKALETRGRWELLFEPTDTAYTINADKLRQTISKYSNIIIADVSNYVQLAKVIEMGNVGAAVTVKSEALNEVMEPEFTVTKDVYSPTMSVTAQITQEKVTIKVNSNTTEGKVILVNVDYLVIPISDPKQILVLFDDTEISMASNYADVVNPLDDELPEYLIVMEAGGFQVLVSIPNFSTHTIVITKRTATPSFFDIINHILFSVPIIGDIVRFFDNIIPGYGLLLFISIVIVVIVSIILIVKSRKPKK